MRAAVNLSQKQLGKLIGTTGQSISNIETGRHCPSEVHLHKILVELKADEPTMKDFKENFKIFRLAHNKNLGQPK